MFAATCLLSLRGAIVAELHVELVTADRRVWSGQARIVVAKTVDGDFGVLPGHAPVLAVLANGVVTVRTAEGDDVYAAVLGGFISVANDEVSILAEQAELASEVDVARAHEEIERLQGFDDPESVAARSRAVARIRAVEQAR
jgi:F-type H+-transporting ATPase subunit epsilon